MRFVAHRELAKSTELHRRCLSRS